MSKLHVTQIGGYLTSKLKGVINMDDYAHHSDPAVVQMAFLTRALTALAISNLTGAPIESLAASITDGQDDGGIDGIYFDPNERTLYLVQSKWHDSGNGSLEVGAALALKDGVEKVLSNDLGSFNSRVKARQGDIQSALYDANATFVLVIAHTGQQALADTVKAVLDSYVDDQNDTSELMTLVTLNQADLHKAVSAGVAGTPISLEIQLSNWGQVRQPHVAYYGQVSAIDIASWVSLHGNRLFSSNLRQFLGGSSVNDDIVDTLAKRPQEFWYLNNGITAIASSVAKKPLGGNSTDSGIFECNGFSVVNGAQTVGSIHAAQITTPNEVAKAVVSVRIISTAESPDSFGSEVTRCTNTQNAIAKRDFVALDPEQERIRQELNFDGVEYAFKAGTTTGPGAIRFDLTEATVAQACASTSVDMAVQAKREISRLWDDISKAPYKILFNPSVSGALLWERVQAIRAIESALSQATKNYSGRDYLICVHGNRFIEWASMQKLGLQPGIAFNSLSNSVPSIVDAAIADTIAAVKSKYSGSYPATLFKNLTKCRDLAKGP